MTIIPEEFVDFLNQDYFQARKIVIVANKITPQQSGRAHISARGYAVGNAFCYEEVKWIPK